MSGSSSRSRKSTFTVRIGVGRAVQCDVTRSRKQRGKTPFRVDRLAFSPRKGANEKRSAEIALCPLSFMTRGRPKSHRASTPSAFGTSVLRLPHAAHTGRRARPWKGPSTAAVGCGARRWANGRSPSPGFAWRGSTPPSSSPSCSERTAIGEGASRTLTLRDDVRLKAAVRLVVERDSEARAHHQARAAERAERARWASSRPTRGRHREARAGPRLRPTAPPPSTRRRARLARPGGGRGRARSQLAGVRARDQPPVRSRGD